MFNYQFIKFDIQSLETFILIRTSASLIGIRFEFECSLKDRIIQSFRVSWGTILDVFLEAVSSSLELDESNVRVSVS
jgi:hypothetical protein